MMIATRLVALTVFLAGCGGGEAPAPDDSGAPGDSIAPPTADLSAPPTEDLSAPPADPYAPPADLAPSSANHLYVATSGSDTKPGTQAEPFGTIHHAATVAKPDTTVHVASGTYTGNVVTNTSGTKSGRIRYV